MTFFRHFPKNFLMTFFTHRPFQSFNCSVSPQCTGGQKPMTINRGVKDLKFRKIYTTLIILSSSKGGGANSITNFDWGDMTELAPPPESATAQKRSRSSLPS